MRSLFRYLTMALVIGTGFESSWCFGYDECRPIESVRIDNVARIFMESPGSYILIIAKDDKEFYHMRAGARRVRYFADVPAEAPMFVIEHRCEIKSFMGTNQYTSGLDIHVRNISAVEGASWERRSGKTTTRGVNQVIE